LRRAVGEEKTDRSGTRHEKEGRIVFELKRGKRARFLRPFSKGGGGYKERFLGLEGREGEQSAALGEGPGIIDTSENPRTRKKKGPSDHLLTHSKRKKLRFICSGEKREKKRNTFSAKGGESKPGH